jgi:Ser/Thr protein kinase RdoA (MazF antagonist)
MHQDELVRTVAAAYGLTTDPTPPRRMGGAINHVLRLGTEDGDVIVRIHRPETTPERLAAVHRVQESLRAAGLPIPAILRTPVGETWIAVDGRLVEVLEFVPGGHEVRTWQDAKTSFTALGRLHAALRSIDAPDLPPPPFGCYAPPETALALLAATESGFRAEAADPNYPRATDVRRATAALLGRLLAARQTYERDLPRTLVHGDFVGFNVLIDEDRVIAILDFDRLSEGDRIFEIARNLMYVLSCLVYPSCVGYPMCGEWPNGAVLSDRDLAAVAHLVATYEASSGRPITQTEIGALPFEMAAAPVYPIAMAGAEPGQAVTETLIFAQHVSLAKWLVDYAGQVSSAFGR